MIRAARLAPSRPMYAFDPVTFARPHPDEDEQYGGCRTIAAVWFRRKQGRPVASMGVYNMFLYWNRDEGGPPEDTYEEWVNRHADNRYGGSHLASWDGVALLCTDQPVSPETAARRVEFLSAMLAGFPEPPTSYDGWYEFTKRPV